MSEAGSFIAKWLTQAPPHETALLFCPEPQRRLHALWATLVNELDEAAFSLSDPGISRAKLSWWGEELEHAAHGEARHPLTRELFALPLVREIDARRWPALALQALHCASDEGVLPRDTAAALAVPLPYARALATVESGLFAAEVTPEWLAVAVLLRQWPGAEGPGRLRWPLQLRARHQIDGDLPASPALLRDFAGEVLQALPPASQGSVMRRCISRLDHWRLQQLLDGKALQWPGRWRGLWLNWRAARRA